MFLLGRKVKFGAKTSDMCNYLLKPKHASIIQSDTVGNYLTFSSFLSYEYFPKKYFLVTGLHLISDNACISHLLLAVTFRAASMRLKNVFFFHLQIRFHIKMNNLIFYPSTRIFWESL